MLIGAVILVLPLLGLQGNWVSMLAGSALVGWFALVLGLALVGLDLSQRRKRRRER